MSLQDNIYSKICICEYDGTLYNGWQFQTNGLSVQECIETVLEKLYCKKIRILGAGRTDAGVHAFGQVFHYRTHKYIPSNSVKMALNSMLPSDISVIYVADAPVDFHPIIFAKSKTYSYKILNRDVRPGLEYNRVWHVRDDIDILKLRDLLSVLTGEHDFSAFCMQRSLKINNTRVINSIAVEKSGELITITVNANGFLHNMMRIIAGTAVHLLRAGKDSSDMLSILEGKIRTKFNKTAPACGLYLMKVYYDLDI